LTRKAGEAFKDSNGLVFIGASGIAVRAVAPWLKRKDLDPGVVVIDELATFVVSLVSGHLGGANRLAREIAAILKATPVITTATDVSGLPCIEDLVERFDLVIEDVKKIKAVNSAILKGACIRIIDADPERLKAMREVPGFSSRSAFRFSRRFPEMGGAGPFVLVSSAGAPDIPGAFKRRTLVLRPAEFVVGMGCRRGAASSDIERLVKRVFKDAGISVKAIRNLATVDVKSDEPGLIGFAQKYGLGVEFYKAGALSRVKPPSGSSSVVMRALGTGAVSEPAALLSSGARRLWVKKKKSKNVTVAVARVRYTS
jgi:cobalt-precorrin 5A hydrolase